jgi:prepilin-type N-terminal cleavage/methylation domain-containing protein
MKKSKNKKGFTLVELLSVILVLGLILVIAVPNIMGSVDESKKAAFKISTNKILEEAKKQYFKDNIETEKIYTIEDNEFVDNSLNVSGDLPDSGLIKVNDDGSVGLALEKGNLCIIKGFEDSEPLIYEDIETCEFIEYTSGECFLLNNISETELEIIGYDLSCSKNVIIPKAINGKTVVSIGNDAFNASEPPTTVYNDTNNMLAYSNSNYKEAESNYFALTTSEPEGQIISVIIPNTVTNIGISAFNHNLLTEVIIPDSVINIGEAAFYYNHLNSVTLSNGITNIGDYAFEGNQLTSITIPDSVINIGGGAFYNNQLTSVEFPNGLISIGYSAFEGNQLTSIIIPNGVLSIGVSAFSNNQLTSVTLPYGLTNIDDYAFSGNLLTEITFPASLVSIGEAAFSRNAITSITIPSSVTSMGMRAFNDNLLPNNQAFLYELNPDGSQNQAILIGYGGANKATVTIPSGVITIGESAFYDNQIESIIIPNTVTTIGPGSLHNLGLTSVTIPNSVTSIGEGALSWNNLTSLTIPNSVTTIGHDAFGYNQLTSVTLSENLTEIAARLFYVNRDLTSIIIPNSVTNIGWCAFEWTGLTSIIIPNNVTNIDDRAFLCPLTSIIIPSNVQFTPYAFDTAFYDAYVTENSRTGGTYLRTYIVPIYKWIKQP